MVNFQVAIDGPAGSGKSSISKIVSSKLGFTHIDTGAMYRAVTFEAINRKINVSDENAFTFVKDIDVKYQNDCVYLNNVDVTEEIRKPIITSNVSAVSKHKIVRDKMVDFQRKSAQKGKIIMDGRDIGTVVLPSADLKVYLTASAEERAMRRMKELLPTNPDVVYQLILKDIMERDHQDSTRLISPLKKADDAITIDTTNLSITDVCDLIIKLVNERLC